MPAFYIKSEQLLDYTLKLQKINDIALPIAVQNSLNSVARDVEKRTLKESTQKEFTIDKKTFFSANSGVETHGAKEFNYNVNKLKAEVGITKGEKSKEKATEQVGNQETATNIDRSVNPLGTKPKSKSIIDVLSKKPEVYQNESDGFNPGKYYRSVARAKKRDAPFLNKNSGGTRGALGRVRKFKRLKSGRLSIKIQPIASYIKGGKVNLKTRRPFLSNAAITSTKEILNKEFLKEADKQVQRAMKK